MEDDEIQALVERQWAEQMPSWAIDASSVLQFGTHLATKDGRKIGNAHIVGEIKSGQGFRHSWQVLTDAGTTLYLSVEELGELFHPPQWVSDVAEVQRKFGPRD